MATSFDPAAATAAYMATLSPEAHLKATHYTQGGHWLLLWGWVVGIGVAWLILRSRMLVRLTGAIERRRPHRNLAALAAAFVFTLLSWLLALPWTIYTDWWRERAYGLKSQDFAGWFAEGALQLVISAVLSSLFLMLLYILIRRTGRSWWAWAAGLAGAFIVLGVVVAPVAIEPLFNRYTPAPPSPARTAVVELAKATGVPSDKIFIFNGSKQSNRYTANVSGLGSSARVAMSDVMFTKGADIAEVRGVVGHEMGHYKRAHVLLFAGFACLMAALGFFLVDRLFEPAARLFGASGVAGIADPAGLPVLVAVLSTLGLLGTPLFNTATRLEEADADHFSLVHANAPDGLSKALVKTIEYRASSPSALEEIVFYDHPSVEHRVRAAMEWKAAHPGPAAKE